MKHKETLLTAARIIDERGGEYGDMRECHERIARLVNDMCADIKLEPHHIAAVHMATKLARIFANPTHADSYVDLAAYTAFRSELVGNNSSVQPPVSGVVTRSRTEELGLNALNDLLFRPEAPAGTYTPSA